MIPAGGSGKLVAKVHTSPMQSGRLSKAINVTTDAKSAESLSLTLAFKVQPSIEVRPRFSIGVDTIKGVAKAERVILHRTDGKPLKVEKFELDDPALAKVTFGTLTEAGENGAQPGDAWVEAAVTAETPVGNKATKLHISTDHPDQPTLDLGLNVRVRPVIEARPERVNLWIDEAAAAGRSASFRIVNNLDKTFEIKEITSSNPDIFRAKAVTSDTPEGHSMRAVQVELVEAVTPASFTATVSGTLHIVLSDPGQPAVDVPVMVSKRIRTMQPSRVVEPSALIGAQPAQRPVLTPGPASLAPQPPAVGPAPTTPPPPPTPAPGK